MKASKRRRLSPKQRRFVEEYMVDLNATRAAIRAGYSERGASVQGHRLLANAKVAEAVQAGRQELSARSELSVEWVLDQLVENYKRACQLVPVLDRSGKKTGEFKYQGQVANRALELIGKHFAMFVERHEHEHSGEIEINVDDVRKKVDRELGDIRKRLKIVA